MSVTRHAAKAMFAAVDMLLPTPPGPRILIYHQVGTENGRQMEVHVEDFEWQLDWLQTNREVVDLETAIRRWHEPGAERLAVITFDDGYLDTYTTAYPRLRELQMPFTLYIATEMIAVGLDDRALSWNQIATMHESGLMTIGSHTHTHRDLRGLSADDVTFELDRSDEMIERYLGSRPRHFTYPWGYWAPIAHDEVVNRYVSATVGAPARSTPFDRHLIHRYPVQLSDGKRWFKARLQGGFLAEEMTRRALRGYRGP